MNAQPTTPLARRRVVPRRGPLQALGAELSRFEPSSRPLAVTVRDTIAIVTPVAIGLAVGEPAGGVAVSVGALYVGSADQGGTYRQRAAMMALAGLAGAGAAFLGTLAGDRTAVVAAIVGVLGLAAGLTACLGQGPAQVGLASVVLFSVLAASPGTLHEAIVAALLVLAGGALHLALGAPAWWARGGQPERQALANLYGGVAALAVADSPSMTGRVPLTSSVEDVRRLIRRPPGDTDPRARAQGVLYEQAERARTEVIALARWRRADQRSPEPHWPEVGELLDAVGAVLDAIAAALQPGTALDDVDRSLADLDARADRARAAVERPGPQRVLARHANALAGQLRAARRALPAARGESDLPGLWTRFHLSSVRWTVRDQALTVRANLRWSSPSFRHGVRLAACLVVATVLVRELDIAHGYWAVVAVALVLRPELTTTLVRGVLRVLGTLVGLGLATLLTAGSPQGAVLVVWLVVIVFALRYFLTINYGVATVFASAYIVLVLFAAGQPATDTIGDRALTTLLGGAIALAATVLWPTSERVRIDTLLGELVAKHRRYLATVLDPDAPADQRVRLRSEVRLARSRVEASLTRLRREPLAPPELVDRTERVLAELIQLAQSSLAMDALVESAIPPPASPEELARIAGDADTVLARVEDALANHRWISPTPNLRADLTGIRAPEDSRWAEAADASINALDTITFLLTGPTPDDVPT